MKRLHFSLAALLTGALLLIPLSISAQPWAEARGGLSYAGQLALGETSPGTVHYAGTGGYDFGDWRLGVLAEHSIWIVENVNDDSSFPDSVLNVGAVATLEYFDERAFTSLAVGPSFLLFDTVTTEAGEVGVFGQLTPVGFRIPLSGGLGVNIRPLNFTISAPIITATPLYRIAFNSDVGLEYKF